MPTASKSLGPKSAHSAFAVALLAVGISAVRATDAAAQSSLDGYWTTQIQLDSLHARIVFLEIRRRDSLLIASIDAPDVRQQNVPLKVAAFTDSSFDLDWPANGRNRRFVARVVGDTLRGTFSTVAGIRLPFMATRGTRTQIADDIRNDGSYLLANGQFVDIGASSLEGGRLVFLDEGSRRLGVLYPLSPTTYIGGPTYDTPLPVTIIARFERDRAGRVIGLTWSHAGHEQHGDRVEGIEQRRIDFTSDGVRLVGTLTLPPGARKTKVPTIVFVHGSLPWQRPAGPMSYHFARNGIAVYTYDKRGAGESGGEANATTKTLAADVEAAVHRLLSEPELDPRAVGVWGVSNGGWVAPLAASQTHEIAFVAAQSASGLPVYENIVYEMAGYLHGKPVSQVQVDSARDLRRRLNAAILSNDGWSDVLASLTAARSAPWSGWWFDFVSERAKGSSFPLPDSTWREWKGEIDFDPGPVWRQVRQPVFVQLAEHDRSVPSDTSKRLIEAALRDGGNRDFQVLIVPNANHGMAESGTGYDDEPVVRLAAGYMEDLVRWIRGHFAKH